MRDRSPMRPLDYFDYDTSVTPGHTPGRYRPHGAIRLSRGTGYRQPVPSASGEAAPGQVRAVEGFALNDALASPDAPIS